MFKEPYSTTACNGYVMQPVRTEVERVATLYGSSGQVKPYGHPKYNAYIITPGIAPILPFSQPIAFGDNCTAIDLRSYTALNQHKAMKVNAVSDYNVALLRLGLQCLWQDKYQLPVALLNAGHYQVTVFTNWLTQLLVRNFALLPDVQMRTTAIIAFYYLQLFDDVPVELDKVRRMKIASIIGKVTYINPGKVVDIIEDIPPLSTIDDLINALQEHGGSMRFGELSRLLMYQLAGGSWFGAHSREILSVALEHPPTFIAILYTVLNEPGYRRTGLGQVALEADKQDNGKAFTAGIRALLDQFTRE